MSPLCRATKAVAERHRCSRARRPQREEGGGRSTSDKAPRRLWEGTLWRPGWVLKNEEAVESGTMEKAFGWANSRSKGTEA